MFSQQNGCAELRGCCQEGVGLKGGNSQYQVEVLPLVTEETSGSTWSLGFVVELERHGSMSGCSAGPQSGCDEGTFCYFLASSAGRFQCFDMGFDAIWALCGACNSQRNQLAVLPW